MPVSALPIGGDEEGKRFLRDLMDIKFLGKYRVTTPEGEVISIEEYLKSQDYLDRITAKDEPENEPKPVYVGTLTKAFGINGYTKAEIGHPVFEFDGKYTITIFNPKNEPHVVSFYKPTLEPNIQKS